jgi:site-specific DNA-cytosine methylase
MNTVELFAGAGGMALGAELAGLRHLALVEFDHAACTTLRQNRPEWPVCETDVRDVDFAQYAGVDLLTAGAPCQPFSTAGRRRLDADQRNMFPEVFRAVRKAHPRAVLLENVKGMLVGDARAYFDYVVGRLGQLGYDVSWRVVNCADYGVPQRRERIFIVCFRRDLEVDWTWPVPTHALDSLLHAQWGDGSYWREHGIRPKMPVYAVEAFGQPLVPTGDPLQYEGHARKARLVLDVVGVGGGPHDTLKNRRYPVVGFNGGAKALGPKADRFFNRRAEAAWELRTLLEAGHAWDQRRRAGENPGRPVGLALPPADRDQLIRELCAIEWTTNGDRKIQLESKSTIGPKLGKGQSPDYFDALIQALATDGIRSFDTDIVGMRCSDRGIPNNQSLLLFEVSP